MTSRTQKLKTDDPSSSNLTSRQDVVAEEKSVLASDDLLRVLRVTKTYGGNKVVDDVSLGVSRDTVFAMLGPNGAGKTTTFNIIRALISITFVHSSHIVE